MFVFESAFHKCRILTKLRYRVCNVIYFILSSEINGYQKWIKVILVVMVGTMGSFSENLWDHFYGSISDKRSARNGPIKMIP